MTTILIAASIVITILAIIIGKGIKKAQRPEPKSKTEVDKDGIKWGDVWP